MINAIIAGLTIAAATSIPGLIMLALATAIIDDIDQTERNHEHIADYMRNMR